MPDSDSAPTGKPLPCPFCGNTEVHVRQNLIGDYYVVCGDLANEEVAGCRAITDDQRCESPVQAIERWNRRVSPALSAEIETELRAIRERAEAATPGPWELWTGCSWRRFGREGTTQTVCEPTTHHSDGHPDLLFRNGGSLGPDAAFIASARSDVPWLLAIIAELTTHLRTQAHQEET